MKKIHLVCNAHIDPVWLWEAEEGIAEAISTFRTAADFCEEYEDFIFNHNEVILYKWVEEYEPELFRRIQNLVKSGKWHIMGGWYLQPDCNMPCGESFVRQALLGRKYFKDKFGSIPTTAINFDPFGHTRGLVQILKKSGYDSYIFCRPQEKNLNLPEDEFQWVGYDGSKIIGHRAFGSYISYRGEARNKVEQWIENHPNKNLGLVLWGIGNHGGGPSRIDLENLKKLGREVSSIKLVHSVPEEYFKYLGDKIKAMPLYDKDLNPWGVGCYTSQIRIKQKHRQLENDIYMVEKMISSAAIQGYIEYPKEKMEEILNDLMFAQFHDILPGSSIKSVEERAIILMDHAIEAASRLKAKAFFVLADGQNKADDGKIPILVYNPHPYKVKGIFECEFQLADQNRGEGISYPLVYQNGQKIPCQLEKEESNINLDWRKRSVFYAELEPNQINRFDCRIEVLPEKPRPKLDKRDGKFVFETKDIKVVVNCKTGFVDEYSIKGIHYLKKGSFKPTVMKDNQDPWGSTVNSFNVIEGEFILASRETISEYFGEQTGLIEPVRVIEDGEVRTVVEAVFEYNNSIICQRYKLPKYGTEIDLQVTVHWNEKDRMLKISIPTVFEDAGLVGQVAYGVDNLPENHLEAVAQKWVGIHSRRSDNFFSCINTGTYGSSYGMGELRISLLRSPAYAALPINDRPIIKRDRYVPRIDQGEREFAFLFNGGKYTECIEKIERKAQVYNEKPYALSFFPSGKGKQTKAVIVMADEVVILAAFKKAEETEDYIIRLFEPTGVERKTEVMLPILGIRHEVLLKGFEIKTLRLSLKDNKLYEADMMEGIISK